MTLTLIFSTTGTLLSRIIRAMSGSEASHCGIGLELGGELFVVDSALLGCEMVTRERWLKNRKLVAEFTVPEDQIPPLGHMLSALGVGYDYSGMFGYFPVWVARWFGRKVKNPWSSPTLNVCTEFVVRTMRHPGAVDAWKTLDPEALYPQELIELCHMLEYPKAR